jgi:Tfp pilus assembly protein PilO
MASAGAWRRLLPAMRPRERRLALIAGGLILSWAVVSWMIQPLWTASRAVQDDVAAQAEKLAALDRLMDQSPAVERAYAALAPYLEAGGGEGAEESLLAALEELSRAGNLQLNLKPRPPRQEGRPDPFEVELDVEGPQEQLLDFMDSVLSMPRLIAVERLRLSSVPTNTRVLRANVVLQQLQLP